MVYESSANDLTSTDDRAVAQIHLYDRRKGRTALVSKNESGKADNGPSEDPNPSTEAKVMADDSRGTDMGEADIEGGIYRRGPYWRDDRGTGFDRQPGAGEGGGVANGA